MHSKMTRRSIVKSGLIAGALVPAFGLIGGTAGAAALTPLDPNDPTAKALGFVNDATKVDAAAGCNIFAGHSVPAGGWCKVYAPKPV
jgi:hypothetical protein